MKYTKVDLLEFLSKVIKLEIKKETTRIHESNGQKK